MILTEDGFVKHELTRDEEDDILNEHYGQNGDSAYHMTKEISEQAQHIKWRRVLELYNRMKAVIYAHVSSIGERQSTDRQIEDLTRYAERKGLELVL